jgi:hypothetical protein
MRDNYLESTLNQFRYYKTLGERTFAQLNDEDLFWPYNPETNSIAVIVKHLSGNMKSRWTDFLTTDGEKEWRNRESEFEHSFQSKAEMLATWEAGWDCLFTALDAISPENFHTMVYIRNQGHTIVEAVNRQLAHYAYHIGQIVFIGKMIKNEHWKSLSIPRGKSEQYNADKFSEPKRKEHFTKAILKVKGSKDLK